jgi:hypothetical protein
MPLTATADHDQTLLVRKINATLQGTVVKVLSELLPEVGILPRHEALERIFDDVGLLERCFKAFRDHPDRFKHLLVDEARIPVASPDDKLFCGRSLNEVVAMVVRTAAKRHFRRRLDGKSSPLRVGGKPRRAKPPRQEASILKRLLAMIYVPKAPVPPPSRGKLLYDAFEEHLAHDWQVPLVPEYATLSPDLVRRLGPAILDYRVADDIRRLRADPDHPPLPTMRDAADMPPLPTGISAQAVRPTGGMAPPPVAGEAARDLRARVEDLLTADGGRLKPEAINQVLLDPKVREALPNGGVGIRVTDMLSAVGGTATRTLVGTLGLRSEQLVVMLVTLQTTLGRQRFAEVFGPSGHAEAVNKVAKLAREAGIDQSTPPKVVAALARAGFRRAAA